MVRIRLLSDLHLELHKLGSSELDFKKEADVVILAGDIGDSSSDEYTNLINMLTLTHSKVIIITGNHEYYSTKSVEEIDSNIRELCDEDIIFLQKDSLIFDRIKFIGCTLWSNPEDPSLCKYMNDFNRIHDMTFQKYNMIHQEHKKWLIEEVTIAKKDYDKICVITHHLPSYSLIDAKYADDPLNSFFASSTFVDMEHKNINAWCYGHTHVAGKNNIDGVDFYCNPRGYANEKSGWNIDYVFDL
uniref:Calcineurin-like phosphoesterase domain-containing protein n=1 Tax=viral metagenome TaxID=1070528 RepID=A0A6C0C8N9_9ZZZZ